MRQAVPVMLAAVLGASAPPSAAWGPDGHSIVAEIAQRHLGAHARAEVGRLLGEGHSLAAEASWADDVRADRPQTFNWHFVDIPLEEPSYRGRRDCRAAPKGDCIVAQLERARHALHCGNDGERREALQWAVHLVADLHQPLHTLAEAQGGTTVAIETAFAGLRCPRCKAARGMQNLHWLWDGALIAATAWNWGAYVRRLEDGWLAGKEARDAVRGSVIDWANESHQVAREVWTWTPANRVIGEEYYRKALPVLDRQLGRAGLRLAAFLDEALAPCKRGRGAKARWR